MRAGRPGLPRSCLGRTNRGFAAGLEAEARVNVDRRCLVIDAQPTLRLGVREVLAERYEIEEVEDRAGALELLTSIGDFDVAIVDLSRGKAGNGADDLSGTAAIRALHKAQPSLGIVAHGPQAERYAATEAIRAGATAYVVKSSPLDALTKAVDAAAELERFVDPATDRPRGRPSLTRRQRQILQLYADGQSTARAAKRLGLSAETVRTHTKAILSRLSARDRAHAVAIALRSALIE
jgi:DNA-binding NarL/FixJ family response regulator